MKKFLTVFLAFCVVIMSSLTVAGCNSTSHNTGNEIKATDLDVVTTKGVVQHNNNYKDSVTSFYDDNYNYWVYDMGLLIDVPLDTYPYFRYGGGNLKIEVTTTKSYVSDIKTISGKTVTEVTSWSNSHSVNVGVDFEFGIKKLANVSVATGYNYTHTNGGSNTDTWSNTFEKCESYSESEAKTITISFDKNCQKGYYRYVYIGVVNVYAVIVQDRSTKRYYNDMYTEIKAYGYCLDYNADTPVFDTYDINKLDFDLSLLNKLPTPTIKLPSGTGDLLPDIKPDVPVGTIEIPFKKESCKTDNGYNPREKGRNYDIKSHENWTLTELILNGCGKKSDGSYYMPKNQTLSLSVKLLQPLVGLPIMASIGWNWWGNDVSNDNYKDNVYGTNIVGQAIGYGAYYVKVSYLDGTCTEDNGVNLFSNMGKDDIKLLPINFNKNKTIKSIDVIVVYELAYYYYEGFHNGPEYSNWRCSATLKFN